MPQQLTASHNPLQDAHHHPYLTVYKSPLLSTSTPPAFASVPHQHLRQTVVALTCPRSLPAWPHASRPPLTSSRAPPRLSTRTALPRPPSRLSRPAAPSSPRMAPVARSTASRPSSSAAPRMCRMRPRWARPFVWRIWCVFFVCLLFFHKLPLGFILAIVTAVSCSIREP